MSPEAEDRGSKSRTNRYLVLIPAMVDRFKPCINTSQCVKTKLIYTHIYIYIYIFCSLARIALNDKGPYYDGHPANARDIYPFSMEKHM